MLYRLTKCSIFHFFQGVLVKNLFFKGKNKKSGSVGTSTYMFSNLLWAKKNIFFEWLIKKVKKHTVFNTLQGYSMQCQALNWVFSNSSQRKLIQEKKYSKRIIKYGKEAEYVWPLCITERPLH
jgi:hypothetical protein